ncbi:Uncharacterised protein [Mycobacterium tuberculosis]|uniref:Uncharacterized protein n=1 Tax=Mycobacterium tuberculosis TaxID=1773 RepID=A0A916LHJ6_MYCTX|nr:Uncharacterised protein [Mycobacterium tuberculosis]
MRAAACLPLSRLRTASTTCAPWAASAAAVSNPSPVLAPVMTAVRPVWSGMSAAVHLVMRAPRYALTKRGERSA